MFRTVKVKKGQEISTKYQSKPEWERICSPPISMFLRKLSSYKFDKYSYLRELSAALSDCHHLVSPKWHNFLNKPTNDNSTGDSDHSDVDIDFPEKR